MHKQLTSNGLLTSTHYCVSQKNGWYSANESVTKHCTGLWWHHMVTNISTSHQSVSTFSQCKAFSTGLILYDWLLKTYFREATLNSWRVWCSRSLPTSEKARKRRFFYCLFALFAPFHKHHLHQIEKSPFLWIPFHPEIRPVTWEISKKNELNSIIFLGGAKEPLIN